MDRRRFFDRVRRDLFKRLSQKQVSGMSAILDAWDESGHSDPRWLAYMLATAFHETAQTMQPIKEYGGKSYFMRMYDKTGKRPRVARDLGNTQVGDGATFCGRGYVQLTGRANYARASREIGVDLVKYPDGALEPDIASRIMFAGMKDGWFTGKRLDHYFNGQTDDPRSARRIINGMDKASTIAGYHRIFLDALEDAVEVDVAYEDNDIAPQAAARFASEMTLDEPSTGKRVSSLLTAAAGGSGTTYMAQDAIQNADSLDPLLIGGLGVGAFALVILVIFLFREQIGGLIGRL